MPRVSESRGEGSLRLRLAPWIVIFIAIFHNLGAFLITSPLQRLLEENICRTYYLENNPSRVSPDGNVPEELCKVSAVQTRLAYLLGLITTLMVVCEFVVTLPLGYISDTYGRKWVLFMNGAGNILAYCWVMMVGYFYNTFPIEAIIVSPFFFLLGGSADVASTNLFAIIADVTKDESQRTQIFSWFTSAGQFLRLATPALSAFAMSRNLWLPFWLGLCSFILVLPTTLLLPETRRNHVHNSQTKRPLGPHQYSETSSLLTQRSTSSTRTKQSEEMHSGFKTYLQNFKTHFLAEIQKLHKLVAGNRNFALCLSVFLVTSLTRSILNILVQYISTRYHKTIAEATYFLSLKAGVTLALFAVIIPGSLHLLVSRAHLSKPAANLLGAKASLCFIGTGVLAVGLCSQLWQLALALAVYSLGFGLALFTLSLATSASFEALDDAHIARTYSVTGLVESAGLMLGIPLMSALWIGALKVGGAGLGLPFFLCAIFYALAGLAIWNLQIPSEEAGGAGDEISEVHTSRPGSYL